MYLNQELKCLET